MERFVFKPKQRAVFVRRFWLFLALPVLLVLVLAGYATLENEDLMVVYAGIGVALVSLMVGVALTKIHHHVTEFELNENTMICRRGILHHETETAPLEMITDASLTRDPLDFLLGSASVRVNTAGEAGYEMNLRWMDSGDAYRLKKNLFELKDAKHARFERSDLHEK
ncbi:MAG: PH domain-containing protein [Candidatus Micrarchaeota archaeon]